MDQQEEVPMSPASLKQKPKCSLTLSCCLHNSRHRHYHHHDNEIPTPNSNPTARLVRTSSSHGHHYHHDFPEPKDTCRDFISRMGRVGSSSGRPRHIRRHSSVDFRYDALSYALNFDESSEDKRLDEYPLRNFTSRLPPSPTREISDCPL